MAILRMTEQRRLRLLAALAAKPLQVNREFHFFRRKWLSVLVGIGMKLRWYARFKQHQFDGEVIITE